MGREKSSFYIRVVACYIQRIVQLIVQTVEAFYHMQICYSSKFHVSGRLMSEDLHATYTTKHFKRLPVTYNGLYDNGIKESTTGTRFVTCALTSLPCYKIKKLLYRIYKQRLYLHSCKESTIILYIHFGQLK